MLVGRPVLVAFPRWEQPTIYFSPFSVKTSRDGFKSHLKVACLDLDEQKKTSKSVAFMEGAK